MGLRQIVRFCSSVKVCLPISIGTVGPIFSEGTEAVRTNRGLDFSGFAQLLQQYSEHTRGRAGVLLFSRSGVIMHPLGMMAADWPQGCSEGQESVLE